MYIQWVQPAHINIADYRLVYFLPYPDKKQRKVVEDAQHAVKESLLNQVQETRMSSAEVIIEAWLKCFKCYKWVHCVVPDQFWGPPSEWGVLDPYQNHRTSNIGIATFHLCFNM